jgi:hypothetical protein
MTYAINQQKLTSLDVKWYTTKPHVVILGAGASLAAFPCGDASGRRLPLMANVISVLGREDAVENAGFDPAMNFESLFSTLHGSGTNPKLMEVIENRVMVYFSSLRLPSHVTIYDLLLLSVRSKDAIFTFNWDPFLVEAYLRNESSASLPNIFHLHGNVLVSFCEKCGHAKPKTDQCGVCHNPLTPSQLLYPVENKNYSDGLFISS